MPDPLDAYRKARDLPPLGSRRFAFAQVKLVLFDIDGTLLGPCDIHGRVMLAAVEHVLGRGTTFQGIDVAGRPDRSIVRALLEREVGAFDEQVLTNILSLSGKFFHQIASPEDVPLIPGASNFLEEVYRRKVPMGLLTGNIESVAWQKMDLAGLRHFFTGIGGFGDKAERRPDLFPLAMARAKEEGIAPFAGEVLLVGDTPRDVEVAHTHGCQLLAVTTGKFKKKDLQIAGAETIVSSLFEGLELLGR